MPILELRVLDPELGCRCCHLQPGLHPRLGGDAGGRRPPSTTDTADHQHQLPRQPRCPPPVALEGSAALKPHWPERRPEPVPEPRSVCRGYRGRSGNPAEEEEQQDPGARSPGAREDLPVADLAEPEPVHVQFLRTKDPSTDRTSTNSSTTTRPSGRLGAPEQQRRLPLGNHAAWPRDTLQVIGDFSCGPADEPSVRAGATAVGRHTLLFQLYGRRVEFPWAGRRWANGRNRRSAAGSAGCGAGPRCRVPPTA